MRERVPIASELVAAACLAAAGIACQGYQFDPVTPTAVIVGTQEVPINGVRQTPNVVIVLDRSGSMRDPAPGQPVGTSKWNDVLERMTNPGSGPRDPNAGLLMRTEDCKARYALVAFPDKNSAGCAPPAGPELNLADNNNAPVVNAIRALQPGGGTPTAAALGVAGNVPALVDASRDAYALLITDGMPNCNDVNHGRCEACLQARQSNPADPCSSTVQPDGSTTKCNPTGALAACTGTNMCLDGAATVAAVKSLMARGVKTFVIGFGTGSGGSDAEAVLNAMALAGGLANNGRYYSADDASQLRLILDKFCSTVQPCTWTLREAPENGMLVVKAVPTGGAPQTLQRDVDYTLSGAEVRLGSAWCTRFNTARPGEWVLQFSFAKAL